MLTRRRFLINSCTVGAATALTPVDSFAKALPVGPLPGYRALVCIMLAGGNDSFNMLVPHSEDQYRQYRRIRGRVALTRSDLLPLSESGGPPTRLALHPSMREVHNLHASGSLALIANAGTLASPITARSLQSLSSRLPVGVMTHARQIEQWQTCDAETDAVSGWGGRMADILQSAAASSRDSMNISLSGANVFQLGASATPCSWTASALASGMGRRTKASIDFDFFNEQIAGQLMSRGRVGQVQRRTVSQTRADTTTLPLIRRALEHAPAPRTQFPGDPFSQRLAEVARIIAARDLLGTSRQTFFVNFGGWDQHSGLLSDHARLLKTLSQGLHAFQCALSESGAFNDVTTFTISEFGRSLTSNGSGSDHGWGGHHIVMGGSVAGGRVFGEYPELSPTNPLDVGGGVYAPTTANEQYFGELARWLGIPESQLEYVLPNIRSFNSAEGMGNRSIRFLG